MRKGVFKSGRASPVFCSHSPFRRTSRKIRVDALFNDYRILSHSNNEITLNLPTEALSTALRSASAEHTGANEVVMKLAKKNNLPVLSFEIFGTTQMGRRVKVAHDVRIEVMKPADVTMLTEPRCPEPDVRYNMTI
jgi:HUS1 checkpoint protein